MHSQQYRTLFSETARQCWVGWGRIVQVGSIEACGDNFGWLRCHCGCGSRPSGFGCLGEAWCVLYRLRFRLNCGCDQCWRRRFGRDGLVFDHRLWSACWARHRRGRRWGLGWCCNRRGRREWYWCGWECFRGGWCRGCFEQRDDNGGRQRRLNSLYFQVGDRKYCCDMCDCDKYKDQVLFTSDTCKFVPGVWCQRAGVMVRCSVCPRRGKSQCADVSIPRGRGEGAGSITVADEVHEISSGLSLVAYYAGGRVWVHVSIRLIATEAIKR